jgi:hypothetical protein
MRGRDGAAVVRRQAPPSRVLGDRGGQRWTEVAVVVRRPPLSCISSERGDRGSPLRLMFRAKEGVGDGPRAPPSCVSSEGGVVIMFRANEGVDGGGEMVHEPLRLAFRAREGSSSVVVVLVPSTVLSRYSTIRT